MAAVKVDMEVEVLAQRMWHRYIQAQSRDDRKHYRRWNELTDDETLRGFRAVARMVLAGGVA
jgi:hypothetical protein